MHDDDDDDDDEFGQEDTNQKRGMPKGTIKHMKHTKDDWYHAVKLYKDKYEDDDDMSQINFIYYILSWGKAGRISKSETNGFSKKYMAYCNGDLKKPRGYDKRNANPTIEAAASVQTSRDTFNPSPPDDDTIDSNNDKDDSNTSEGESSRGKRRRRRRPGSKKRRRNLEE